MSLKTRLAKLEKKNIGDRLWALIGIGRPRNEQHERLLKHQARESFFASGGDKKAYLAFLPFESFDAGFIGYVTKSDLMMAIMNKSKNPAES